MSILLPWDRKKPAKKGSMRETRASAPRTLAFYVFGVAIAITATLLVLRSWPIPAETIWEIPSGRLVSSIGGRYLVSVGSAFWVMDGEGKVQEIGAEHGEPVLGQSGVIEVVRAVPSEKVVSVLPDSTVLTLKPAEEGKFGEPWELLAYGPSGNLLWRSELPGVVYAVSQMSGTIAVAVTDISSGGIPSLVILEAETGRPVWAKSLQGGLWRALGVLEEGSLVAVLDSGVTAVREDGSLAWVFAPKEAVLAAAVVGNATCISLPVSRGLAKSVYPYEVQVLSADGSLEWSRPVRQRPMAMQQWMGEEALIALAENHVLGFKIRDGERLFAEKTGAYPVSLTGDKLLLRDARGLRLVRFRSVRLPAK